MTHRRLKILPAILVAVAALVGSGDDGNAGEGSASGAFPLTFENCGQQVTVEAPPQRVFLLGADSVPLLEAAGALGRVTSYDYVYGQIEFYGRLFDTEEAATAAIGELRDRVRSVKQSVARSPARTAATLFVGLGGYISAYGARSIAAVQMETVGLTNVFADVDDRVFEVGLEELLARNPDVLILIHTDEGSREEIKDVVAGLPGAGDLTAVRNDDILVQNAYYSIPATPLTVEGIENIAAEFGGPAG